MQRPADLRQTMCGLCIPTPISPIPMLVLGYHETSRNSSAFPLTIGAVLRPCPSPPHGARDAGVYPWVVECAALPAATASAACVLER